jgi:hypothetical protein
MKVVTVLGLLLLVASVARGSDCSYWHALFDRSASDVSSEIAEQQSKDELQGIRCLLKMEGHEEVGVLYGAKGYVSQRVPKASVEISAPYQISILFYGNDEFAQAVALTSDPPKQDDSAYSIEFNSRELVKRAFASYRKWFAEVEKIGLEEARAREMDPLAGSGVRWY